MSNNFGEIVFGAGAAILTPYATNGPANPTPVRLPIMQELGIDFSGDIAELYGQDQYPYGIARTKMKIECKSKSGAIYASMLGDLFFGFAPATGQTLFVIGESDTVASHTTTVTHSANFIADCGVINAATNAPYRAVAATPAVGQYTVAAGVYTFNSSDTITTALITYTYSSSATGESFTVTNQPMGAMPTFDFKYLNNQYGNNLYLEFYKGVAKKISLPNKNTEFEMMDFDFSCFSLLNGNVFAGALDL